MKVMLEQIGATGRVLPGTANFDAIVAPISEGAAERDADPAFPHRSSPSPHPLSSPSS